jgi:hypothetical protein
MLCREYPPTILWTAGIAFPLERLHHLIVNGIWSDVESEKVWNEAYPGTPYQLWNVDPTTNSNPVVRLQEMEMICPWCQRLDKIDLAKFTLMHCRQNIGSHCTSCEQKFDIDSLSAQILKQDLLRFLSVRTAWYPPLY